MLARENHTQAKIRHFHSTASICHRFIIFTFKYMVYSGKILRNSLKITYPSTKPQNLRWLPIMTAYCRYNNCVVCITNCCETTTTVTNTPKCKYLLVWVFVKTTLMLTVDLHIFHMINIITTSQHVPRISW